MITIKGRGFINHGNVAGFSRKERSKSPRQLGVSHGGVSPKIRPLNTSEAFRVS